MSEMPPKLSKMTQMPQKNILRQMTGMPLFVSEMTKLPLFSLSHLKMTKMPLYIFYVA